MIYGFLLVAPGPPILAVGLYLTLTRGMKVVGLIFASLLNLPHF